MSIIEYDKIYSDLLCDDAPITDEYDTTVDPWDGVKSHADGGFYEIYCREE